MHGDICQFCAQDQRVPAVRTWADPRDGYVYRLCERHYAPLRGWTDRPQPAPKGGVA